MKTVLCKMKLSGLCRETDKQCVHAVPHAPVQQRGGGTCKEGGECVLLGQAKCLPVE
jgi:hypothetical protein